MSKFVITVESNNITKGEIEKLIRPLDGRVGVENVDIRSVSTIKKEQYRQVGDPLDRLVEELAEAICIAQKIKRFGADNFHPDDLEQTPNSELLRREMEDVLRVWGEVHP